MNLVNLELALKRRWHEELVRAPHTHAWVLNLYRAGEHHPDTVDDYFPVEHAPGWLAPKLAAHREDERRHVKLYTRAIEALGEPLEERVGLDVFNVAIRTHTARIAAQHATFRIHATDTEDARTLQLAHFLAHAHFLEARIARSLDVHLDACARSTSPGIDVVTKAVRAVCHDEHRHAAYTREAVLELLPRARAHEVLAVHRRGEARANLAFSARQVRDHLARHRSPSRITWRACASLMERALALRGAAHG